MNTIESLEAYLAYKEYMAAYQATQATGQRGALGSQDDLGPDTSQSDQWVPGQGSTRTPLYTSHERFRVAPDGVVVDERASGRMLMFSTAADGSIRCYEPDTSTTTVFSETSGHVTVQVGTASTLFDTPGNGTIVEHNADSTTTTFTLNADDSLSTATERWYDDGQAYRLTGGVTQYTDTNGNLVHQVDASGVDQYYRNGSLALKTYNDANGHLVREYTHPNGSRTRVDYMYTVTAVFLPDGTSATKQADNTWRGTDGSGAVYNYGTDGWPTTKTASGTTTTWSHNATTRTNFANGNITWTGIDGITVTKAANGTVTGKDAQGNTVSVTTTALSGGGTRYQINLSSGNIKRRLYTDLRDETVTNNGVTDTRFADGTRTLAFSDGTTVQRTASGSYSATSSTNQTLQMAAEYGGRMVLYRPDGLIAILDTDYSITLASANGVTHKTGTGGGTTIKTPSGLKVTVPSSGSIVAVDANNNSLAVVRNADNTLDVTLTDGSTMHFASDAWDLTQIYADHHSVEDAPDGTVTWRDTQGRVTMERATDGFLTQYTYAGDGTSTVTTSDGNVRARRADGTTSSLQKRDGTTTYYAANGTTVASVHTVSGVTVTYDADGSRSYALPNGWTTTLTASNQASTVDASSNPVATTYSNGVFTYPNNRLNADLSWDALTNGVLTQHLAATNALTLVDFDGAQVSFDPTGVLTGIALGYAGGTVQATHQQDGTWQLTIPGGATHGYRATGSVGFIQQPDTSRDDYDPQGRVIQHRDAAGLVTSYSYAQDDTKTEYDASGRIVIWRPDGTRSQEIFNSITTSYDATGFVITAESTVSGITKTVNADGSLSYLLPDGLTAQVANGAATVVDAQGQALSAIVDGGGNLLIRNAANTFNQYRFEPSLTWRGFNAAGSQIYLLTTDGASQATNPDASVVFKDASGAVTQIQMPTQGNPVNATHNLDGTWSGTISGDTHTYRADGSELAVDYAGGAHEDFDAQSRLTLHRDANAQVTTYAYAVDGTKTETDPDGTVITWRPDSTRQSVVGTNGITTTYRADGAAIASQTTLSGVSKTNNTDGSTDYVLPNGYNATTLASGDVTAIDTHHEDQTIHAELDVQTNLLFYSLDDSYIEFKLDPGLDWHSYSAQAFQIRVVHPDASSESWLADGTDIARDAAGIATSIVIPGSSGGVSATHNQDGTWSATFVNGDLHTWRTDGSLQSIDYASGARNEYDADGHLTLSRTAAGVVTTYAYADGALLTTTTTALDGSRTIAYADGHTDWQRADGTLSRRDLADGEMQMFDASGTHLTLDVRPDGTSDAYTWAQDGSCVTSHRDAQGAETTREGHDPAGFLIWTRVNAADGTSTTTYTSGIIEHRRADDTLAERDLADGAVEIYDAQGSLTYTRVTAQDGSSTLTYADGTVEQRRANGTLAQRTLVSGTVNVYRADETLEQSTLPDGTVETYNDAGSRRTTVTRPGGSHDAYTYATDDSYQVSTFDATDALVERRAYSATDALIWTRVDAEDGTYTLSYPSTIVEHYRADATLAERDLADGTVQTFDTQARMTGVTSPDGATLEISYLADGTRTEVSRDAASAWVKTAFYRTDATLDRIEHADGATEYFDQDGDLMTSRVLGDGTIEYVDDEGRVERRQMPDGSVTRITWQENGRTEDTDDAQGAHVRHATYDAQGALVLATDLAADGSSHLTYGSGVEEWLRPDATLERRLRLDGATEGYDAAGTTLLTVTWPDQRVDHFDAQGRIIETDHVDGSVTTITYNVNGSWQLHLVDDQQAFVRDENHRVDGTIERITFADGHVDLYDATGSRVAEREYPDGTIDQLDLEGRVVREDRADGSSSLWSFAPDGANTRRDYDETGLETLRRAFDGAGTLVWSRVFAADRTSTTTYASGRVEHLGADDRILTADEDGNHEVWTWTADGSRAVRITDAAGAFVREVSFTAEGVRESLEHPDGQTDWFDETGTAIVETDFPGGRLEYYDAQGRIVELYLPDGESELIEWAPDGGRTVTAYDADGWEVEVRAYDAASTLLWAKEEAEDGTAEVVYPSGQLDILRADQTLVTRFLVNGEIEHYLPDGLRVDHIDRADGSSSVYAWTETGHSVSDRDAQGVETQLRAYDEGGLLLSTRVAHADGTAVITYATGQEDDLRADATLSQRLMPNGDVITFEADGVHRVQLLRADGSHLDYAYDTAGCTATDRSAEGAVTAVSRYDLQGAWLETRTDAADGTHELLSADGSHAWYRADETLSRRTAADGSDTLYADDGVHVLRTDYADGASVAFSYDEAGEVQTTTHVDAAGTRIVDHADGRQERYSSDGTLLYARAADGTAIRHDWASDGSHADVELDAAGLAQRVLSYDADDVLVSTRTYAPDRTSTLTYESGVIEQYRADGTLASRSIPDSDVTLYDLDGIHVSRITHPDASAEVYTWSGDGAVTVSHVDADGVDQQRVTTQPDGVTLTRVWTTDRTSTVSTRDAEGTLQRVASYDAADAWLQTVIYRLDGTVRTEFADGHAEVRSSENLLLSTEAGGITTTYDAAGAVTSRATISGVTWTAGTDGAFTVALPQGLTVAVAADGTATTAGHLAFFSTSTGDLRVDDASSSFVQYLLTADLSALTVYASAASIERVLYADGGRTEYHATGDVTFRADGTASGIVLAGESATLQPDGTFRLDAIDGTTTTWNAEGVRLEHVFADGVVERYDAQGRVTYRHAGPDEMVFTYAANGAFTITHSGGNQDLFDADGHLVGQAYAGVTRHFDAAFVTTYEETGSGVVRTPHADGSITIVIPNWYTIEVAADASAVATDSDGLTHVAQYAADTHELHVGHLQMNGDLSSYTVMDDGGTLLKRIWATGDRTEYSTLGDVIFDLSGAVKSVTASGVGAVHQGDGTWRVSLPDGATRDWDAQGRLAGMTSSTGAVLLFDAQGRVTSMTAADGTGITLSYTTDGCTVTPSSGAAYTRLLSGVVRTDAGDGFAGWYDAQSRPVAMASPYGFYAYSYDQAGTSDQLAPSGVHMLTYLDGTLEFLSAAGRLTGRILPDQSYISFTYLGTDVQRTWSTGVVDLSTAGGTMIWRRAEGTTTWFDTLGRPVIASSGSDATVTSYDAEGTPTSRTGAVEQGTAGTFTVTFAQGDACTFDDHGVAVRNVSAGGSITYDDGSGTAWMTIDASGVALQGTHAGTAVENAGHVVFTRADGVIERWTTRGILEQRTALDGIVEQFRADGTRFERDLTDGTREGFGVDGTTLAWQIDPSGLRVDYLAGGATRISTPSGLTVQTAADGTATWTQADGTVTVVTGTAATTAGHPTVVHEDGSVTIDNGDATTTTLMADCSVLRAAQDGISLLVRADGSERWLEPGGIRVEVSLDGAIHAFDADNEPITAPTRDAQGNLVHAQGARVVGRDLTIRTYEQSHLVTLTRLNGDVETYRVDGAVARIDHADGMWEAHFPDGFVIRHAADGAVLGIALGSTNAVRRLNGGWFLAAADGTDHTFTSLGSRSQDFPMDGTIVTWFGDGMRTVRDAEGAITAVLDTAGRSVSFVAEASGARVYGPGTRSTLYGSDLNAVMEQGNGTLVTLDQDAHTTTTTTSPSTTVFASGVTRTDDGHGGFALADPSGARIDVSAGAADVRFSYGPADGVQTMTRPDGSTRRVQEDQSVLERDAAGTIRSLTLADGTRAVRASDGTWSATAIDGGQHTYAPDGTARSLTRSGLVTRFHVDGTSEIQYADRVEQLDAHGVVTSKTWPDGRVETWRFGRLVRFVLPGGTTVDRQWLFNTNATALTWVDVSRDPAGALISVKTADGTILTTGEDGTYTVSLAALDPSLSRAVLDADGRHPIEYGISADLTCTVSDDRLVINHQLNGQPYGQYTLGFDGTREDRISDNGSTTVTTWRDGRIVQTLAADGTRTISYGDGGTAVVAASGVTLTSASLNGLQGERQLGISWKATEADGTTHAWYPDGHVVVTHSDGTIDRWLADGTRIRITGNGAQWFDAAGRLVREQGAALAWAPDGRFLSAVSVEDAWQVTVGGNDLLLHADGAVDRWTWTGEYRRLREQVAADGTITTYTYPAEGVTQADVSDGRQRRFTVSGVARDVATDGTVDWTVPDGPTVHIAPDGTLSATMNGAPVTATLESDGTITVAENPSLTWSLDASTMSVTRRAASGVSVTLLATGRHEIGVPEGYAASLPTPWHDTWSDPNDHGFTAQLNADLTITRTLANGYRDTLQVDGSHQIAWPDLLAGAPHLTTTVAADGTVGATVDGQGHVLAESGWNALTTDGLQLALRADHTVSLQAASGLTMTDATGGGQVWTLPNGLVISVAANGTLSGVDGAGTPVQQAWRNADGGLAVKNGAGVTFTVQPDLVLRLNVDGARPFSGMQGDVNRFPGDGRLMLVYPDGHLMASAPDGTLTYTAVDGTLTTDGATTTHNADGSLVITRPDGSVLTWAADGTVSRSFRNGVGVWYDPYRGHAISVPGGLRLVINEVNQLGGLSENGSGYWDYQNRVEPDMTVHATFGDGIRQVTVHPDMTVDYAVGQRRIALGEDGRVAIDDGPFFHAEMPFLGALLGHDRYGNAVSGTVTGDGAYAFTLADGSTRTYGLDLSVTQTFASGVTLLSRADGTCSATTPAGVTLAYAANGTLTGASLDGTSLTVDGADAVLSDGTRVRVEGTTIVTTLTDGAGARLTADGNTEQLDADGQLISTSWALVGHNLDGTTVERDANGVALSMSAASGDAPTLQADGTWLRTDASGAISTYDLHGALVSRIRTLPFNRPTETLAGDGTITLALPDGLVTRHVDPRTGVESVSSDAGTATLQADGSIVLTTARGRTDRLAADLSLVQTDAFAPGYRAATSADGSMTATWYDGTTTSRDAAGVISTSAALLEDGTYAAILSDGSRSTYSAIGVFTGNLLTIPGGYSVHIAGDGARTYTLADGTEVTVAVGTAAAQDVNGAALTTSLATNGMLNISVADGQWIIAPGQTFTHHRTGFFTMAPLGGDVDRVIDWNGDVHLTQADGAIATVTAGGAVSVTTREGVTLTAAADGSFIATLADGSVSTYDVNGQMLANQRTAGFEVLTYTNDGTRTVSYASGVARAQAADGSAVWTIPGPDDVTVTVSVGSDRSLAAVDTKSSAVAASWAAPTWWGSTQDHTDLVLGLTDGTRVLVAPNGLWRHVDANGLLLEIRRPDGIVSTRDEQGGWSSTDATGATVETVIDNGAIVTNGAWGTLKTFAADHWLWTASSALVEEATSATVTILTLPGGQVVTRDYSVASGTDGWAPDSASNYRDFGVHHWNGQSMDRVLVQADGTVVQTFGSGVRVTTWANGERLLTDPQGHQLQLAEGVHSAQYEVPAGVTHTIRDDGTVTVTSLNGASRDLAADGTSTWVFANGFRVHLTATGAVASLTDEAGVDLGPQGWVASVSGDGETVRVTRYGGEWKSLDGDLVLTEDTSRGPARIVSGSAEEWRLPGDTVVNVASDGTLSAHDTSGIALTAMRHGDGQIEMTDNMGIKVRVGPALSLSYSYHEQTLTWQVIGRELVRDFVLADGTTVRTIDDHVDEASSHDALGVRVNRDGLLATVDGVGNVLYRGFDGTAQRLPDLSRAFARVSASPTNTAIDSHGNVIELLSDGIARIHTLAGDLEEWASNGVKRVTTADGHVHWELPDGTLLAQQAEGDIEGRGMNGGIVLPTDARGRSCYVVRAASQVTCVTSSGATYALDLTTLDIGFVGLDGTVVWSRHDGLTRGLESGRDTEAPVSHDNPDGTVATRMRDETSVHFAIAGASVTTARQNDGTYCRVDDSGAVFAYDLDGTLMSITESNGTCKRYDRNGSLVSVRHPDGMLVRFEAGGEQTLIIPDVEYLIHTVGGDIDRLGTPDYGIVGGSGSTLALRQFDGSVGLFDASATLLASVDPDFTWHTYTEGRIARTGHSNGDIDVFDGTGRLTSTLHSDGTQETPQFDGSLAHFGAEGNLIGIRLHDVDAARQDDGTWWVREADGTVTTYGVDGSPVSRIFPNEAGTITWNADGTRVEHLGGDVTCYRADGTRARQSSSDGTVTEYDLGGNATEKRYLDGSVDQFTVLPGRKMTTDSPEIPRHSKYRRECPRHESEAVADVGETGGDQAGRRR